MTKIDAKNVARSMWFIKKRCEKEQGKSRNVCAECPANTNGCIFKLGCTPTSWKIHLLEDENWKDKL